MAKTTLLIWRGGDPYPGWPASDHEEPDPKLYQEKLASRLYRSPDDDEAAEQALAEQHAKAAKANANAQAAKAAQAEAERAKAAAERAAQEAADREARAKASVAAAKATLKEVEGDGTS
jgi:hypothetical protein